MSIAGSNLWLLFVRKAKVFIPTMARTEAGFYMGIEPVAVVDSSNREAVRSAFLDAIGRGNPIVPTPTRATFPPSPLLKHANVKSLSTFEKNAQCWKLGKYPAEFVVAPYRPGKYGGSEEDDSGKESFSASEPIECVVDRLLDRALAAAQPA